MTPENTRQELTQLLSRAGIRPSIQRLAILEYITSRRIHPSADEVYADLVKEHPMLSRTTVFNSLHLMAEKGLVNDLNISAESTRFDSALRTPHAHFLCHECGKIFDIAINMDAIKTPDEFSCDTKDVFFRGLCPDCKTKKETNDKQ